MGGSSSSSSSNAETISDASQSRFSREEGPPQPCSTAMRSAGQASRRAITPRAKRTRVGSGGCDCGGCVAPDDETIVLSEKRDESVRSLLFARREMIIVDVMMHFETALYR